MHFTWPPLFSVPLRFDASRLSSPHVRADVSGLLPRLRCDRQRPCSSCVQRELGLSCTYASDRVTGGDAAHQPRVTTQDRIRHLESLVFDLMQQSSAAQGQHGGGTPCSPVGSTRSPVDTAVATTPADDYGSMRSTGGGANYVVSSHWAAVLDGIAELKDHFDSEDEAAHSDVLDVESPTAEMTGLQLLYGPKPASKDEILASILSLSRPVVDRLVSRYFNSFEMSPAVLHSVEFLKEYEEFWDDPSAVSPLWLGLLFTIMCLATQFEKFRLDPGVQSPAALSMERDLQKMADTYRLRIGQCLVLGNYTKGGPYVLETLMLYIAAELFSSTDAEIDIWILTGNTVQIALHMGYHRDPKHFKGMSSFAAEMRRRVWATLVEMDLGLSAQMGLPRMIKQWQTDTQEPSNLQDSDFDKATVEMPPSRPEAELTPILYRLVKARLMTTVGYIWDFAADVRPYTYIEVKRMDSKLDEARKSIPDCLRWHSFARCITDSPQNIMQKVVLETLVYRAKIVLHQKFMFGPLANAADSRRIVLESALKLLDYQHMLQEESQPFCQLYQERWRVSSLVNHDFLLATSILCYYLQNRKCEGMPVSASAPMDESIMVSLRRSYDIWLQSSDTSKEARKVVKALNVVLGVSNTSGTDSGFDSSMSSSVPLGYASSAVNDYQPGKSFTREGVFKLTCGVVEIPAGLGSQFPMLDGTMMPNWATFADDLLAAPMATPSNEWQAMDDSGYNGVFGMAMEPAMSCIGGESE
ncbi:transcriptional regulatory [Fusarium pseudoanthophilum]|uniref:Transcriptional regulatory n=1 Tax=Fusarium pseudoanthophilum TaxID=48495 RepID=A0A8H5P8A6_9HYPO|nr:transcriptional regulatory [Fusarium pseudoanthophilum]